MGMLMRRHRISRSTVSLERKVEVAEAPKPEAPKPEGAKAVKKTKTLVAKGLEPKTNEPEEDKE